MKSLRQRFRRFVRSDWLRRVLCYAIHLAIRFVYLTNRWSVEGGEHPRRLIEAGQPFILAFWHGRMMMIPMARRQMVPIHMLISAHRDGRIIADAVAHFGIHSVAGSTRRGGRAALRAMVKHLAAGDCVGITPDGPSGPAMVASSGIVNVARLARVPIVPVVFATSRRRVLRTWDRMHVALPFGRGVFIWGEPIEVEPDLDEAGIERERQRIEQCMTDIAALADSRVRRGAAKPAPVQEIEAAPALARARRTREGRR
jgi:hypothetical protein